MKPPPAKPGICRIAHVNRLASLIAEGGLWSDAEVQRRRLTELTLKRRRLPPGRGRQYVTLDVTRMAFLRWRHATVAETGAS